LEELWAIGGVKDDDGDEAATVENVIVLALAMLNLKSHKIIVESLGIDVHDENGKK
jgi:hypothetical protein